MMAKKLKALAVTWMILTLLALLVVAIIDSASTEGKVREAERAERVNGIRFEPAGSRYPAALDKLCPTQPRAMTRRRCAQWILVGQCETGGQQRYMTPRTVRQIRWRYNGSSGYDGALQFSVRTWRGNIGRIPARKLTRYQRLQRRAGRYHHAWSAPPAVQILAAETLRLRPDSTGLGNWPSCGSYW